LIVGLADFEVVENIQAIGPALAARIAELQLDDDAERPCPAHAYTAVSAGERLWGRLTRLGHEREPEFVAAAVMEEFGRPRRA
jgi:hypothetical protein